jgi:hypothetical protein
MVVIVWRVEKVNRLVGVRVIMVEIIEDPRIGRNICIL